MRLRQGDIVLIPVPFTDLSSRKRRPVVVISTDTYNAAGLDMVVVAMTSSPTQTTWSFVISSADMTEGHLNRPGTVRVDKIYTLEQSLAIARFGKVSAPVLNRIRDTLLQLVHANA
jgi:mRNA interferase MazF